MESTFNREDLDREIEETAAAEEIAEDLEQADEAEVEVEEELQVDEPAADADPVDEFARKRAADRRAARVAEVEAADRVTRDLNLDDDLEISQLPVFAEAPEEPMPDMADPDVMFDNEKLRAKTQSWLMRNIERSANRRVSAARTLQTVEARAQEFEKTHPDFDKVVRKNMVLARNPLSPLAGSAVANSKHVAEVLYFFGCNPRYAAQVSKLPVAQQLLEVGKVEARVRAKAKTQARTTSTAQNGQQRQAAARKGPLTREQQLGGKTSMNDIAGQHRAKIKGSRFYGK